MWYIQIIPNEDYDEYNIQGIQLLYMIIDEIYNSMEFKYNEDYKIINNKLEKHIKNYINKLDARKIELIVYNYGIDNAIVLLNHKNNTKEKYINTSSINLLYCILKSKFNIHYIIEYSINPYFDKVYCFNAVIIIQKFWRKVLSHKNELKKLKAITEVNVLIDKINKEIDGEPAKKVLIYLVNKFKKRMSTTLHV